MQTMRATNFLDSLGVNVHTSWEGATDNNVQNMIADLKYIGINNLREEVMPDPGNSGAYARLDAMAKAGMHFDFMISTYWKNDLPKAVSLLHDFAVSHPGSINAIEGLNEVDLWQLGTYKGMTGNTAARAFQQDLYNLVNADAVLKDIKVFSYTYAYNDQKSGSMVGMADVAATHRYHWGADPQPTELGQEIAETRADKMPGGPVVITETGHITGNYNDGYVQAVDQTTEAKLALNTFFEAAYQGVMRTYVFEMFDQPPAIESRNFGMYTQTNAPKVQAHALHNLTTILADSGTGATHDIPVTLTGMPSTAHSLLMEKSNGTFDLAVWNMPDIWDDVRQTAVAQPAVPVTVNLGATYHNVSVYDPLKGTGAVASYTDVSSLVLQTPDHPLIVEFSNPVGTTTPGGTTGGGGTTAPDTTTAPVNTTIGWGSKSLVLKISQDAWHGDAQYQIRVDGKLIGGTLTAHAHHGDGLADIVTVKGRWATDSTHKVSVTFLNDAWGGTPDTDRNLYVEGVSYRGATVSDATSELYTSGAHADYTFH